MKSDLMEDFSTMEFRAAHARAVSLLGRPVDISYNGRTYRQARVYPEGSHCISAQTSDGRPIFTRIIIRKLADEKV